jgi:hypothetical protein
MIAYAIAAAALLEAGCAVVLLLLLVRALLGRAAAHRAAAASAAIRPAIRQPLIEYLAGCSNTEKLREFAGSHRRDLAECILELRHTLSGDAGDRLWDLTLELSVLDDWCADARSAVRAVRRAAFERLAFASAYERCRRVVGQLQLTGIEDSDPEVRLAAARGLAQSLDLKDIELVFRQAVRWNPLARAVLAEVLRPHALALAENAVPRVLRSREDRHVLAALEIIIAWGRAVPLSDLHRLIDGGAPAVRVLALRALPLVASSPDNHAAVLRALSDSDREVAREAMAAAGRLHMDALSPAPPDADRRVARV